MSKVRRAARGTDNSDAHFTVLWGVSCPPIPAKITHRQEKIVKERQPKLAGSIIALHGRQIGQSE
jgi:hypothetical protein